VALEALARLRGEDAATPAARLATVERACDAVRGYVAAAFGVHALESTSEETAAALPEASGAALRAFLAPCDLAKFAGRVPSAEDRRATLDAAVAFVGGETP
jgi:hypothetical protein